VRTVQTGPTVQECLSSAANVLTVALTEPDAEKVTALAGVADSWRALAELIDNLNT
jgi:hypothetical protein